MSKSMRIQFDGAFIGQSGDPRVQRVMYPWTGTQGPIISGKLIVNHREDVTLKALTLTFKASISCYWTEGQGNSTAHFSARKPLLEKTWVFLEKSETRLHLLRANQNYIYDFQLALPVNLPNSLAMGTGKIEYLFSANGKRASFVSDLAVDRVIEIYQSLPPSHEYCIYPIQQTADFEQALNYLVQIPRKAFHHGAVIPITVRMNPIAGTGARWLVMNMHIKIKEYLWFISPGKGVRHEKRSLIEAVQGSGSWPVQVGPVERVISVNVPAFNVMSTVDTEIVKCTHKLKIIFTLDVNGLSKKLSTDSSASTPGSTPGIAAAPPPTHPYSQGYPTPTTAHSYPLVTSSQGYPTPVMPPMPSPSVSNYPLPPSPAQGHAPNQSVPVPMSSPANMAMPMPSPSPGLTHMTMPVPSPIPSATQASYVQSAFSPTALPATSVASQQQQHHQIATPPKLDSPREAAGPQPLQMDDTIKVYVNMDDTIKVNLDDIKIPSTPSTPAAPVASATPTTPSVASHSKNPQLRESDVSLPGNGQQLSESNVAYKPPPTEPTKPKAPQTINEAGENQYTYQPPPPSSSALASPLAASFAQSTNPYAAAAAAAAATTGTTTLARAPSTGMNSSQQHDLSSHFSQMGLQARSPPPPSPSTSFSHPVMASPGARSNSNYSSAMSPISAAATGAVVASQHQQQLQLKQQQQYQPPPATSSMPQPPPVQHYHQQQPRKQQIWIPMYQTLNGKVYVQYKPAA
ncbi:hypothetical protein BGZ58_002879 [Dissophora ornata]|nr:hypothetical protein BGZ58_002879 [Dissophora ornata]